MRHLMAGLKMAVRMKMTTWETTSTGIIRGTRNGTTSTIKEGHRINSTTARIKIKNHNTATNTTITTTTTIDNLTTSRGSRVEAEAATSGKTRTMKAVNGLNRDTVASTQK
jgi:hypothetical protein